MVGCQEKERRLLRAHFLRRVSPRQWQPCQHIVEGCWGHEIYRTRLEIVRRSAVRLLYICHNIISGETLYRQGAARLELNHRLPV